ncbi:MAG TPA: MupA/Atu3671 family FMN-dependent luciferase-like monooxygenase [Kofleriaceae bacterium]|nr:MupA/Atu3671 family FMN-dependent luciferase-like monooxygenase [Kofleriaceae bacterium]
MSDIQAKLNSLTPEQRKLLLKELQKKKALADGEPAPIAISETLRQKGMDFSLIFFSGNGSTQDRDKYDLVVECARFADRHGFSAVTTPERHFQPVGGLFPNPAVLSAALAMVTERIQLRAGSVVIPLHDPLRVAEEWSVVDNLSRGRVAISFATGWHPADFILSPAAYADRRGIMQHNLGLIRRLWRGESIVRKDIEGNDVEVRTLPVPIQRELPIFITSSGNPATWVKAGELGANVLCSLTNHTLDSLNKHAESYRAARAAHGFDPDAGVVSVMVHTFVGRNDDEVKELVRHPLRGFLNEYINQNETLNPYKDSRGNVRAVIDNDREALITYAFEKHFNQTSLMGSREKCARMVQQLHDAGATEIACLVDFGLTKERVLAGLEPLAELAALYARARSPERVAVAEPA